MRYESKIIGINPIWISVLLIGTFLIVCATGGNNVHWGYLGFEVIFPFYTAVIVGEWCKTRTDPMFEVICTQGKPLFYWILRRFVFLFGLACAFVFIGILGVTFLRENMNILDLILTFFPTAFMLSSLCVLVSLLGKIAHIPTMLTGVFWLFSIMAISLLRIAPIRYIYLFARYAGINGNVGIANKIILSFFGLFLWWVIFVICKRRTFRE